MLRKNPRIRDVAINAGVSTATASRVLSGADYAVSEELRSRVLQAAEDLKYTPNMISRVFRTGKNDVLGVLVPNITSPDQAAIVAGIEEFASREGFVAMVSSSFGDIEREKSILRQFQMQKVSAVIISAYHGDGTMPAELEAEGIPLVLIGERLEVLAGPCITVDLYNAMRETVAYLVGRGHTDIGYVGAPTTKTMRESEWKGYLHGMANMSLKPNMSHVYNLMNENQRQQNYEHSVGERYALRLLSLSDMPSAVIAANDLIAIGCIQTLVQAGIRVPEDVSFVGVNDIPAATLAEPKLTTMRIPSVRIGRMAAKCALRHSAEKPGKHHIIKPNLVERMSVAGCRTGHAAGRAGSEAQLIRYAAPDDLRIAKL